MSRPRTTDGLTAAARRICEKEYRTLNIKTNISPERVAELAESLAERTGARVAWATHPAEDGGVAHCHIVAQFRVPTNCREELAEIAKNDQCWYCQPCRIFKSSYRYLAHLDNPEKCAIPISAIHRLGDWQGTPLGEWHIPRKTTLSIAELVQATQKYRQISTSTNPLIFAMWLESNAWNARTALASLRQMGIALETLFALADASNRTPELYDRITQETETP